MRDFFFFNDPSLCARWIHFSGKQKRKKYMSSSVDQTPSPVRAVRQFEADEAMARKLQQEQEDELRAREAQALIDEEAEFDRVTRSVDEQRDFRLAQRLQD
jgi:hypothetical protein